MDGRRGGCSAGWVDSWGGGQLGGWLAGLVLLLVSGYSRLFPILIWPISGSFLNFLFPEYTCGDTAIESLLIHQGAGSYACGSCGKTSAQKTDLMKHIISKHVVAQAIACQFCGKKYKNQNSLQVHISQNHRELWQQTKKMG